MIGQYYEFYKSLKEFLELIKKCQSEFNHQEHKRHNLEYFEKSIQCIESCGRGYLERYEKEKNNNMRGIIMNEQPQEYEYLKNTKKYYLLLKEMEDLKLKFETMKLHPTRWKGTELKLRPTRWRCFLNWIYSFDISLELAVLGVIIINYFLIIKLNLSFIELTIESIALGLVIPRLLK